MGPRPKDKRHSPEPTGGYAQTSKVRDGLHGATWLRDFGPNLNFEALHEFFLMWDCMPTIQLEEESEDTLIWRWKADRRNSWCSAYKAFFAAKKSAAQNTRLISKRV
jgi:hypothetical protein